MTQLGPAPDPYLLGTANRRFSTLHVARGGNALTTGRLLGMWVPAECFKIGTRIGFEVRGANATSGVLELRIGGNGVTPGAGIIASTNSAPAVASWHLLGAAIQITDGVLVSFQGAGGFMGATSAAGDGSVSTGVFLQPLNYVELRGTTDLVYGGVSLSIFPAGNPASRVYQEILSL